LIQNEKTLHSTIPPLSSIAKQLEALSTTGTYGLQGDAKCTDTWKCEKMILIYR